MKDGPQTTAAVPRLENGDRLTREEFHRRYLAMPTGVRAELIDGVVYMPSPMQAQTHSRPAHLLRRWLGEYEMETPGLWTGDDATVRLGADSDPQPDGLLMVLPEFGGAARFSQDDYIEGPPELLAEITASSVSIDLGQKLDLYRRSGIREYLVWRVEDELIDWFVLRRRRYVPLAADAAGVVRSETFPGLWLDTAALLRQDARQVRRVLTEGVATPEHAAFVARLAARRG